MALSAFGLIMATIYVKVEDEMIEECFGQITVNT